jgi:hypothetical protein
MIEIAQRVAVKAEKNLGEAMRFPGPPHHP